MRSMTAFARAKASGKQGHWTVEIRSVNNRFLDLSLRIPAVLNDFEPQIRDLVQSKVRRGKVLLNLSEEEGRRAGAGFKLNEARIRETVAAFRRIQKKYRLSGDLGVRDLLQVPGIFEGAEGETDARALWTSVRKLLLQGLSALEAAREAEGKKLAADLLRRLGKVGGAVDRIESAAEGRAGALAEKLRERVRSLLQETALSEDERFHREVAYLAEKTDVTEEIVRLRSHLGTFEKKLRAGGEAGRELDFFCQEINREANTIGSKSQDVGIAKEVILIKGELEKIREQVQNLE